MFRDLAIERNSKFKYTSVEVHNMQLLMRSYINHFSATTSQTVQSCILNVKD